MVTPYFLRRGMIVAAAALGITVAAWPAAAQNIAIVSYVPVDSHPPIPFGLQLVCVRSSDSGAVPSKSCPVIKYQGITTWPYSYLDNRMSLALVSYDADNNVIATIEKPGARYAFEAVTSVRTHTVMFVGQARREITVTWDQLGRR